MLKLTPTQTAKVGLIARNYADYRIAKSNADDFFIARHGGVIIQNCKLMGISPRDIDHQLEGDVAQAVERMQREAPVSLRVAQQELDKL